MLLLLFPCTVEAVAADDATLTAAAASVGEYTIIQQRSYGLTMLPRVGVFVYSVAGEVKSSLVGWVIGNVSADGSSDATADDDCYDSNDLR